MFVGKYSVVLFLAILSGGCAKQVIDVNASQRFELGAARPVNSTEITSHFFFSDIDLGLNEKVDAAAICHGVENIISIETNVSFLDSMLSGITYGFYT
ncbi:Bor family protein, partial [Aeromonas hydrophila]|uniref:Bor family protein n=2 Tax=Aeromonadaceae TaxID=84642 RepID=UPI0020B1C0FD